MGYSSSDNGFLTTHQVPQVPVHDGSTMSEMSVLLQGAFTGAPCALSLVGFDDLARNLVQAVCAVLQFGVGAAALFAGVAGQLHAVDGKHLAPDQAQPVAGEQHLGEQTLDVLAQLAHELGDVRVAGLSVTAQGGERRGHRRCAALSRSSPVDCRVMPHYRNLCSKVLRT